LATGATLIALILTFGPISGARFNPVVSVADGMERGLPWSEVLAYIVAQLFGGVGGTVLAHVMFSLPVVSLSHHMRSGPAQFVSEFTATFGLLCVIWGCSRFRSNVVPFAVGSYITAAYWFTASTSFANPAVTIARALSDTFAGIRPIDVPLFVRHIRGNAGTHIRDFVGDRQERSLPLGMLSATVELKELPEMKGLARAPLP